jgi:uncharacterized damage-inducible protein DinB
MIPARPALALRWCFSFLIGVLCPLQVWPREPVVLQAAAVDGSSHGEVDKTSGVLDAEEEKRAARRLLQVARKEIVSAAEAMPADKYSFVPTEGEFQGVRSFGEMVKHLSATNYILAAAALGEAPPPGAGDEAGPETVRTKAEILEYLRGSFAQLDKAIDAVGQPKIYVRPSPISPLRQSEATGLGLVYEALLHAFDHYGQMVEYLRMNGVVPPASRP